MSRLREAMERCAPRGSTTALTRVANACVASCDRTTILRRHHASHHVPQALQCLSGHDAATRSTPSRVASRAHRNVAATPLVDHAWQVRRAFRPQRHVSTATAPATVTRTARRDSSSTGVSRASAQSSTPVVPNTHPGQTPQGPEPRVHGCEQRYGRRDRPPHGERVLAGRHRDVQAVRHLSSTRVRSRAT